MKKLVLTLAVLGLAASPARAEGFTVTGTVIARGVAEAPIAIYIEHLDQLPPPSQVLPALNLYQDDMRFKPAVAVLPMNTKVNFPNQDRALHRVFSPTAKHAFDLGPLRRGTSRSRVLTQPGELAIRCAVHPHMMATILVLQNNCNTSLDAPGTWKITNVPAGRHTLVAWSISHEPVKHAIEVAAGPLTGIVLELVVPRSP